MLIEFAFVYYWFGVVFTIKLSWFFFFVHYIRMSVLVTEQCMYIESSKAKKRSFVQ